MNQQKTKKQIITILLTTSMVGAGSLMSGCGQGFSAAPGTTLGASSASSSSAPSTKSEQLVSAVAKNLNQNASASKLSQTQISTIISGITSALQSGSLTSTDDLKSVLPVLVQGALSGIGQLGLSNSTSQSAVVASIGSAIISALPALISGNLPTAEVASIAATLFSNLTQAGVIPSQVSGVASGVVSTLLADLSKGSFASSDLTKIVESLASGVVSGLGQSSSSTSELSAILNALGSGSLNGLTSLTSSTAASGAASVLIQDLIAAFTSGASTALSSSSGSSSIVNTLLSSLLAGMNQQASGGTTGSSTSPTNSAASNIIGALLGALISKI